MRAHLLFFQHLLIASQLVSRYPDDELKEDLMELKLFICYQDKGQFRKML